MTSITTTTRSTVVKVTSATKMKRTTITKGRPLINTHPKVQEVRSILQRVSENIRVTSDGYVRIQRLENGTTREIRVPGITKRCSFLLRTHHKTPPLSVLIGNKNGSVSKYNPSRTKSATRGCHYPPKPSKGGGESSSSPSSSKTKGKAFHRHIFHELMCVPSSSDGSGRKTSGCLCGAKFQSGTRYRRPKADSDLSLWIAQAKAFLEQYKLEPVMCEAPVYWGDSICATEIDLLAWSTLDDHLVNVSWKTGYGPSFSDDQHHLEGCALSSFGLKSSYEDTHHLQQQMENQMLQKCASLRVERNYIVYFGFGGPRNAVHILSPSMWRYDPHTISRIESLFFVPFSPPSPWLPS